MPKKCVPELKIKPLASHCLLTAETYAHDAETYAETYDAETYAEKYDS